MNCPICHKTLTSIITNTIRDEKVRKVFFCNECELGVLDEKRTEKELKSFYSDSYRKTHNPKIGNVTSLNEFFNIYIKTNRILDRVKFIEPYLNKDIKLLEIGCQVGMFLHLIKSKVKEITGLDYDVEAARFASEKCKCKVYTSNLEDTDLMTNYFDVICFFQVLEHISNPIQFLKQCYRYLNNKGLIYIEVPNLYDALVYVYNLPYHKKFFYHSAHILYFTKKSLQKLMEQVGFEGKVYYTQDYDIFNHINWILNDTPESTCVRGLKPSKFPFKKIDKNHKKILSSFIKRTNEEYKNILETLGYSSNLIFIGKKNG